MDGDTLEIHQFVSIGDVTVPLSDDGKFSPHGKPTKLEKFAVGQMAGIEMAIQDLKTQGFDFFRMTDYVTFECVDVQPPTQAGFSEMPLFSVSISDKPPAIAAAK